MRGLHGPPRRPHERCRCSERREHGPDWSPAARRCRPRLRSTCAHTARPVRLWATLPVAQRSRLRAHSTTATRFWLAKRQLALVRHAFWARFFRAKTVSQLRSLVLFQCGAVTCGGRAVLACVDAWCHVRFIIAGQSLSLRVDNHRTHAAPCLLLASKVPLRCCSLGAQGGGYGRLASGRADQDL